MQFLSQRQREVRCLAVLAAGLAASCAAPNAADAGSATAAATMASWVGMLDEAQAHFGAGRTAEALALGRQALASAEADLDPADPRFLQPLLFVSSLLLVQQQAGQAEPLVQRARGLAERELQSARTNLATVLKYLGAIHGESGQLDAAQEVLQRAYALSVEAVGAAHPESAKHLGNLGALHLRRGDAAAAEDAFVRALEIWSQMQQPHPVYAAGVLCNLAELRMQQARPDEALELAQRAVAMQERAFAAGDPRLGATRSRCAALLRRGGRGAEADALLAPRSGVAR